jgi:hypothetical protein
MKDNIKMDPGGNAVRGSGLNSTHLDRVLWEWKISGFTDDEGTS